MTTFRKEQLVQYWFDTGAMGYQILYGRVIAAGPKAFRVLWESGLSNRLRQDCRSVKLAEDQADAHKAMSR